MVTRCALAGIERLLELLLLELLEFEELLEELELRELLELDRLLEELKLLELDRLLDELELIELLELDKLLDELEIELELELLELDKLLEELELFKLLELDEKLLEALELTRPLLLELVPLEKELELLLGVIIMIWLLDELLALAGVLWALLALLIAGVSLEEELLGIGLLPVSSLLVLELEAFCDEIEVALTLLALEKEEVSLLSSPLLPPPQAVSVKASVKFKSRTDVEFIIFMAIPIIVKQLER